MVSYREDDERQCMQTDHLNKRDGIEEMSVYRLRLIDVKQQVSSFVSDCERLGINMADFRGQFSDLFTDVSELLQTRQHQLEDS